MIEVYTALCLKEPWLELILLHIKTLESRTKCLRHEGGPTVLASSKGYDERAWEDPTVGGLLDSEAKRRAMEGRGKLRGFVPSMGGFRLGVPDSDDVKRALITMVTPRGGIRFVADVTGARRLIETPTVRVQVRDEVEKIVEGSSQGLFRVPKSAVKFAVAQ